MLRFLSFALAAALLTTACGDDDESISITEDQLVGTWNLESADIDASQSTSGVTVLQASSQTTTSDATVTFDADGTYAGAGAYTYSATVSNAGTSLPASESTLNIGRLRGNWSLSGTTVTLSGAGFGPDLAVLAAFDINTSTAEVTQFTPDERLRLTTRIDTSFAFPNPVGAGPDILSAISGTQTIVLTQ